jgi:hypothetical protein
VANPDWSPQEAQEAQQSSSKIAELFIGRDHQAIAAE